MSSHQFHVHDPVAAGRRLALQAVGVQAVVAAALVAMVFPLLGTAVALSCAVGAAAMVAGNGLAAWVSLRRIGPARAALAQVLAGTLVKWCMVVAALVVTQEVWRTAPLPMLCGLALGVVVHALASHRLWTGRGAARRRVTKG